MWVLGVLWHIFYTARLLAVILGSNVNSRGSSFWVNLWQRIVPSQLQPASSSQAAELRELPPHRGLTDVVVVRDELWEQLSVWEQGWVVLLFSDSGPLYSASTQWSAFVLFSVLASPLPGHRHMVSSQLDTEPRAVGRHRSEIATWWAGVRNVDFIAKDLQLLLIHNLEILSKKHVAALFHENENYFN